MAGKVTNNSRVKKNALEVEDINWEDEFKKKTATRETGSYEGGEFTHANRRKTVVGEGKGIKRTGPARNARDDYQPGRPGGTYKAPTPTKKEERPGGTYKNRPAWYYGANNVNSITVKSAPKEEKKKANFGSGAGVTIKTKKKGN